MKEINIESIEHLILELNKLPNNYIYRGHSDTTWRLQSTLERVLGNKYVSHSREFEKYAIDNFSSRFHLYNDSKVLPISKLEWLSTMQHYGVPTRLLDFTTSPYVALYFAIENIRKTDDGVFDIYALNYRGLLNKSLDYIKKHNNTIQVTYEDLFYERNELFTTIDEGLYEILWVVEPNILNLRLERQSGCFLIAGNTNKTIEQILINDIYSGINNYRFIVPNKFWGNIYTLLQRMNIDSKTIYGDLEGLSKSIRLFMQAYS